MNFYRILQTLPFCLIVAAPAIAQQKMVVGKGSYASYAPLSKSRTTEHGGDQSQYMQYRTLNIREEAGRPIPTNDWWTNLINAADQHSGQELTGHLWSYPQYVQGMKYGIDIHYPKYWVDNGTEMKAQSKLAIKCGDTFHPSRPIAEAWSDWTMTFSEESDGQRLLATLAHGMPFTWVELDGITPVITAVKTNNDGADNLLRDNVAVSFTDEQGNELTDGTYGRMMVRIGNQATEDLYGIYLPEGAKVSIADGQATVVFSGDRKFMVVALLADRSDLEAYAEYAYSKPIDTQVAWNYAEGTLSTRWTVTAEDLRTGAATDRVLQGFIPHHYRERYAAYTHSFLPHTYATPRGKLKLAAGDDLSISYRFSGMLPWYAVPNDETGEHAFMRDRMLQLIQQYAQTGTFGADTYWGGKGLTQMALNMTFAREMGDEQLFRTCHDRLKEALVNWLTWTPGEDDFFFAYDPRYHGLIGYNTSYDSDTYNDHHFHYGYFTLAAALLAMVDDDFRVNYGDMIGLVARDYANYKRDSWSCFLRMMDPWAGHSYAGGLGDGAGNGQESTSEAMQGWGGLYLLGVALRDDEMRDAGIFGWVLESRATAEYWYDRHGEPVGSDFHTMKSDDYNIDYNKFRHTAPDYTIPYSSNLTCHGVGWWTWFGGDPVFMQGIQWMPISPALDYLGEDKAFAAWDYQRLMELKEHVGWQDYSGTEAWLGDSDWGNVVLAYRQWSDPDDAAAIFDQGWNAGWPTMRTSSTNGITYYITHSHRSWGDIDWNITANYPTARVYDKDGTKTHIAYNPTDEPITVVYSDGTSLTVPARQMKVEGVESAAFNYVYPVDNSEPDLRERLSMKNLALGKACTESSHENAGTVQEYATDGDLNTRWGSEHRDGEWLQVDLGEEAYIYKVRIRWEASYAAEYRIELRNTADGAVVYSKTGIGKANDWTELKLDDQSGRYVRLIGVKRGSAYGTSLYELEVYGKPSSAADTDLMGVEITCGLDVLKQGVPTTLTVQGYDYAGMPKAVPAVWSSEDGTFNGDDFTPSTYGLVSVSTPVEGMTATKTLPVEESLHLTDLVFNMPAILVKDVPVAFTLEGKDQFGAPYEETPVFETSSPLLSVDNARHTAVATATGVYTVTARMGNVEAKAEVTVISSAVDAPSTLSGKVPVFVGNEEPSMNFDYNGGSQKTGGSFLLTPRCRAIYVKQLGTCGFGALGDLDLGGANMLHADIYPVNDAPNFSIHIEGAPGNREYAKALKGGQWNSIDLPVTNTTANWLFFAFNNYRAGENAALIANVYFYTEHGDKVFVGDPDARGIVSVTTFGAGITDENCAQFIADVAQLPATATAIDLSNVALNNSVPMTLSTPNNPNTVLLLSGDGGDDNAASPQAGKLTNSRNLAYNAGGWILPLKSTDYQMVWEDGYPVLPMNFGRCTTLSYTATLTAESYVAICLPCETVIPEGVKAYRLGGLRDGVITFDGVTTGVLAAYHPYLLYNTTASPVTLAISSSRGNVELARGVNDLTTTVDGINLVGNFQQFRVTGSEGCAVVRPNGGWEWLDDAGVVGSFRAYLSGVTPELVARGMNIDGEIITGIDEVRRDAGNNDGIYTITGMRVTQPVKGIYIMNGKKYIVR